MPGQPPGHLQSLLRIDYCEIEWTEASVFSAGSADCAWAVSYTHLDVYKRQVAEMDLALKAGILIFNLESESEVALLAERAAKLRIRARVALRVNPHVFAETHPYISTGLREHKFGIDIKAARPVYQEVKRSRYLDPVGISVHIGSQIRSSEPFGAALEGVAELIRELRCV